MDVILGVDTSRTGFQLSVSFFGSLLCHSVR